MRESGKNFRKLNPDIECLLINIGSLDKGHTYKLITEYVSGDPAGLDARKLEIHVLRDGLNDAIMPFYVLFKYSKSTLSGDGKAAQLRFIDENVINKYVDGPMFIPPRKKDSPWKKRRPV
jgi:hypothetical protein